MTATAEPLVQIRKPTEAAYWVEMVKCRYACPVHTDACGYVTAIAEGRYEDAYRKARATNPFASICGRVCGAPCEVNCRRGAVDKAVTIRALKRFVNETHGPETGGYALYREAANRKMLPPNRAEGERVAVIGAGVSGLTVAHDLSQIGYQVTVFEANAEPGGMLMAGVPVFRLPRDLVRHEIQAILSLGVELRTNQRLGRDFTIADLRRQGFRAVFLGIGLPDGRRLPIPGNTLDGVYDGMEFLRAFNEGKPLPLGERVVVIGGGNVAYDVARSALRPAWMKPRAEHFEDVGRGEQMAYDVARSALRMSGDKEIHVVCLEDLAEMPADEVEIVEGREEGIRLHTRRGPREIVGVNGRAAALRLVRCLSVFDNERRFRPVFDESSQEEIACDNVIFAIGQQADLSFLSPEDGVETERGLIKVDPETYQTTAADVFACGDVAHGPRLFIDAVASAQIAARSMHDLLRGTRTDVVLRKSWRPALYTMTEDWRQLSRRNPPAIESSRRAASNEIVEERFSEEEARRQASRCLRCNVNTVFDTSQCVACNGCVDVCPENLIRIQGFGELGIAALEDASEAFGIPLAQLVAMPTAELNTMGGVMTKDESTCIRCALCASRCPTHAITMQLFEFDWECVTIPSPNTRLRQPDTARAAG